MEVNAKGGKTEGKQIDSMLRDGVASRGGFKVEGLDSVLLAGPE